MPSISRFASVLSIRFVILYTMVAFYISGFGNHSIAICQLTALSYSLTFLRLYVHRRQICQGNGLYMFSLKIRTVFNMISRAEKEGRLDLKGSTGRPKKVTQRVERNIIKIVYDSSQFSTRGLALQLEKDWLRVTCFTWNHQKCSWKTQIFFKIG